MFQHHSSIAEGCRHVLVIGAFTLLFHFKRLLIQQIRFPILALSKIEPQAFVAMYEVVNLKGLAAAIRTAFSQATFLKRENNR